MAVSDDVRVNPESASILMQVPGEIPEGVSDKGIFGSVGSCSFSASRAQPSYSLSISDNVDDSGLLDHFDYMLISPGIIDYKSETSASNEGSLYQLPAPSPLSSQIEIISVTRLDTLATNALKLHLQKLSLSVGFRGEIVFELPAQKGRVKRVMLDEKASTLKEATVIDLICAIASFLASSSIDHRHNSPNLTHPLLTLTK